MIRCRHFKQNNDCDEAIKKMTYDDMWRGVGRQIRTYIYITKTTYYSFICILLIGKENIHPRFMII
jgi:hypothetical protein